jgi:DNA-directed RNA polymerase beta subunit
MSNSIDNKKITMSAANLNDVFDIENEPYIETPWNIIESYFKGQQLERFVRHQLESYNNFVSYQIIKTIEMFNPLHIASEQDFDQSSKKYALEIFITFENFHIYRPQIHENNGAIKLMFPQEARLRNFTYSAATTIDVNIKYVVRNGSNLENTQIFHKTIPSVHIGKLPIMLKSNICVLNQYKHFDNEKTGECKFDAGGYFIILNIYGRLKLNQFQILNVFHLNKFRCLFHLKTMVLVTQLCLKYQELNNQSHYSLFSEH